MSEGPHPSLGPRSGARVEGARAIFYDTRMHDHERAWCVDRHRRRRWRERWQQRDAENTREQESLGWLKARDWHWIRRKRDRKLEGGNAGDVDMRQAGSIGESRRLRNGLPPLSGGDQGPG